MNRNTWKQGERRIAKEFNTTRTPLSGINSKHTRSDTLHNKLFIEIKHRKVIPGDTLFRQTERLSKIEKKIPIIVFIKKNFKDPVIMCRLKDIDIISGFKNSSFSY